LPLTLAPDLPAEGITWAAMDGVSGLLIGREYIEAFLDGFENCHRQKGFRPDVPHTFGFARKKAETFARKAIGRLLTR